MGCIGLDSRSMAKAPVLGMCVCVCAVSLFKSRFASCELRSAICLSAFFLLSPSEVSSASCSDSGLLLLSFLLFLSRGSVQSATGNVQRATCNQQPETINC